jgi:hypothetical protein
MGGTMNHPIVDLRFNINMCLKKKEDSKNFRKFRNVKDRDELFYEKSLRKFANVNTKLIILKNSFHV